MTTTMLQNLFIKIKKHKIKLTCITCLIFLLVVLIFVKPVSTWIINQAQKLANQNPFPNAAPPRPDPSPSEVSPAHESLAKLKVIRNALKEFRKKHGTFPTPGGGPRGADFPSILSWRVQILPHLGEDKLYHEFLNPAIIANPPKIPRFVSVFQPPVTNAFTKPTDTYYRVFVGNGAAFEKGQHYSLVDFPDGTINTLLVVEAGEPTFWTEPEDMAYDPKKPLPKLGFLDGGFHALMADGAIRWIPTGTDEKVLRAMITRNGNEHFNLPGDEVSED